MSGGTQQQNRPVRVSVKRELRQSNLLEIFKKQKINQLAKPLTFPSTSIHKSSNISNLSSFEETELEEIVVEKPSIVDCLNSLKSAATPGCSKENTVWRSKDNSITITAIPSMASSPENVNSPVGIGTLEDANTPEDDNALADADTLSTELNLSPPLFSDYEDSCASSGEADICMGTPPEELNRMPECSKPFPPVKPSSYHTVMIRIPMEGDIPQSHPDRKKDIWDNNHVRMPCSCENLYPVADMNGSKKVESRWNLIKRALHKPMVSSLDLEEAIMTYNSRYADKWDFSGLHAFFTEVLDREEAHAFFSGLLPKMIDLALALPEICTMPIPLLRQRCRHTITMSQKQVSSLLANAFFCTFPRRNAQRKLSEYSSFPDINFNGLFSGGRNGGISSNKAEKLKCIIHYFRQATKREPKGTLSFCRQSLDEFPKWEKESVPLTRLHVSSSGTIEDEGFGMLQVDFANKFIGGGVLHRGCVQEEIRFVICPELLITRLFTEVLEKNECLIITGCERFSKYDGYADTFQWNGSYHDKTPRDSWGRRCTQVVAIDAIPFRSTKEQYSPHWLNRELNKAFVGFFDPSASSNLPAIATGNWGCGAFRGDPQLKSLLQLMAAAKAGRDVMYFTFRNPSLCREIFDMHSFLVEQNFHIGQVWKLLVDYHTSITANKKHNTSLFTFIYNSVSAYNSDTDVDETSSTELQREAPSKVKTNECNARL